MNFKNALLPIVGIVTLGMALPVKAMAAPHFTLTPSSANETVGQNFVVTMGIDSDTEKVIGVDIKATFDASKLEIVSIDKGTVPSDGYNFTYTASQPIIHNDTGAFEVTLPSADSSVYTGAVAKHELLKITFKPKTTGVATLNYVCSANSVTETNIIGQAGSDVVDCASNQSGSYTISAGVGGDTTTASTVTATPTVAGSSSSLPKTGVVENTILMVVVGLGSMIAAAFLKLI